MSRASRGQLVLVATIIILGVCAPPLLWFVGAVGLPQPAAHSPTFRPSPVHEQAAAVFTFFGVKFIYSIIAAGIAGVLWRTTARDLAAVRRAMILFFTGEAFCFVNVMVFHDQSVVLEHLHSVGMVLALAYTVYAMLETIDYRFLHYSDNARCAAVGLCRACIKHNDVKCGLRRLFLLLAASLAVVSTIPLFSAFRLTAYSTRIFGMPHLYSHPAIHQSYELRYLPIAAIILLCGCFFTLLLLERHLVPVSKILFSAGVGAIGFSFFRLALVAAFADNLVWFAAWEETTELVYVAAIGATLLIFARGLRDEIWLATDARLCSTAGECK